MYFVNTVTNKNKTFGKTSLNFSKILRTNLKIIYFYNNQLKIIFFKINFQL